MRALIMTQVDGMVDDEKQRRACWDYVAGAGHLEFGPILHTGAGPKEAAASVAAGEAEVVVAAYRRSDIELTGEIEQAGGTVEYVHRDPPTRLTVRGVFAALHRQLGWSAQTIARTVGANTEDVREHLRRAGIRRQPKVDE